MIGSTSLINIDLRNKKADIGGITIDKKYQDLKLGFDAFDQVLDYSFNELGLNKLSSGYLDSQMITAHGLKKYGFVEELLLREEVYKLGKFHNVVVVSFLASEYRAAMEKVNPR
jgi:RimJ/RimL family protein N-acetyltransferase